MDVTFIGERGSIRYGRKSLSIREVAQKVEQPSQRREASSSDLTTNPRTSHEVVTFQSFDNLFEKLTKVALHECNIEIERRRH